MGEKERSQMSGTPSNTTTFAMHSFIHVGKKYNSSWRVAQYRWVWLPNRKNTSVLPILIMDKLDRRLEAEILQMFSQVDTCYRTILNVNKWLPFALYTGEQIKLENPHQTTVIIKCTETKASKSRCLFGGIKPNLSLVNHIFKSLKLVEW